MQYQVLNINIDYEKIGSNVGDFQPTMTVYLPNNSPEIDMNRKRPTVVICPGGAYAITSDREAEPIALKFVAEDCNAVVVRYSCAPRRFPSQLLEVSKAVQTVRENAEAWNVDPDKIAVLGFSAGGHLAASYGMLWNKDFIKEYFGYQGGENKPNGMILCYPVLSMYEPTHMGSVENLLGDKQTDAELLDLLSVEKQVSADTPKAFIWHTFNDPAVPALRSLELAAEIWKQGGSAEVHVFPNGPHGMSLANDTVFAPKFPGGFGECAQWIDLAIRWTKQL